MSDAIVSLGMEARDIKTKRLANSFDEIHREGCLDWMDVFDRYV